MRAVTRKRVIIIMPLQRIAGAIKNTLLSKAHKVWRGASIG
jgi:hypothetical protein